MFHFVDDAMSHVGRLPEIGLSWLALLYVVLYEAYGGHLLLGLLAQLLIPG